MHRSRGWLCNHTDGDAVLFGRQDEGHSGFSVTKLEGLAQHPCWVVVGEDPGSGTEERVGEQIEISWGRGAGSC